MIYEVEFTVQEKSNFKTIYSALVFAHTVSQCKERASEIAQSLFKKNYIEIRFFIQEFID